MGLRITARNQRTQGQAPADYGTQDPQNADMRLAESAPTRTGLCKLRSERRRVVWDEVLPCSDTDPARFVGWLTTLG